MFKFAAWILKENASLHAENIVQECFLYIFSNVWILDKFDKPSSPETEAYLTKMVKSRCMNFYREHKNIKMDLMESGEDTLSNIADENGDIEKILMDAEITKEMSFYTKTLDPLEQAIINLKYYEGFKNTEIARELGISDNLVGVKLYRAKRELARKIQANQGKGDKGNG